MDAHKNLAYSLVATAPAPAASGTTLVVTAGQGTRFPATPFNATVWAIGEIPTPTNAEIVRVTNITGDTLTITRAQEGTNARTVLVGDQIAATYTVKTLTDIETAMLTNINVSAGALAQNLSALTFSNASGVSFGLAASVITATVATNYAGTNGAITGGSITVNTSGVSVNLPAYLTTAALSNHSHGDPQLNLTNLSGTTASNSAGLTLSLSGFPAQTVQTQNLHNLTLAGNTAGVLAHVSSGTLTLAGGNNITVSQAGNAVTISGANVGGAQTGISGIAASNTTYTSGSVTLTGVGGGVTVGSNTGQRVDISVAAPVAQTVQTQNLHNLSLSGNTAGVLAQISSGTAILAGGNNITLSQNGQSITISGANVGGAQTGISGVVVSDTTYTSGTVSFSNAGNITISSSVNGATQYIRLSGHAAQTTQSAIEGFGVSNTGQTAGNTGISTGVDWILAGSGSITLSQSTAAGANTVWIQHPAWITTATQSTQFLALTLGGNTAGTTTFHATNNASLFLNGGNNITLSGNGSTVTISAAAQTVQTQNLHNVTLSGNTAGVMAQVSSGTLTLAGGNNITLSQNGNAVTISGANVGGAQTAISGVVVSDTTYTSGTVSFSNQANITIGSSVNGATQYIRLSGNPAQTVQSAIRAFGVSNTGQTAGNTGVSTGIDWVLAGSSQVTLSQSTAGGGPNTVWIQHPAWLSTQSTQFLALTLGGNTAGTTTFHATNNASLFLNGGNNITLSGNGSTVTILGATAAPSPVNFSAGTTSNNLGSVVFSDSHGISFGLNGSTITASAVTVGTATTVTPVASANSVGTVTRWAAEDHRHAGVGGIGISTSGNTSGTTGSQVGTYWLEGGNNITLSQITSNNGSHTLVISGGGGGPALQFYDNAPVAGTTTSNPGQMTLYLFPFTPINEVFPANMSVSSLFMNVIQSVSTAATWTNQVSIAFYSSVNSTQLTRVVSGSTSWGTNAGNMNINDSFGGTRWLTIHSSNFDAQPVFSEGVRYWCALWHRTSNNAGSMTLNWYGFQTMGNSAARSGIMGLVSVANSSLGWGRFLGIYSATFSTAMPAALAASDINKSVAQVAFLPQVILNNVATNII